MSLNQRFEPGLDGHKVLLSSGNVHVSVQFGSVVGYTNQRADDTNMGRQKIFEYLRLVVATVAFVQGTIYLAWVGWTYEEPKLSFPRSSKDVVSMPGATKMGLQLHQAKQATQKFANPSQRKESQKKSGPRT